MALAKPNKPPRQDITLEHECSSDNAQKALDISGIIEPDPGFEKEDFVRWKIATWATQAAISRLGKRRFEERPANEIKFFTNNSEERKWPRGRAG